MIECVIPILCVSDVTASVEFYQRVLGFQKDFGADVDGGGFAGLSRDGCALYLAEGEQGQPGTWVWIGVEDIDTLLARCRDEGVRFIQEPTNYPWAYEFRIADPDGHVLRIGGEPRDV